MKIVLRNKYFLLILSGVLFSLAWYEWFSGLVLLIAFVPLLIVEEEISKKGKQARKVFLLSSITFVIWNFLASWWIKNATIPGFFTAVILTTLFMAIPFTLYHVAKNKYGKAIGSSVFILAWLAYEFSYMHGEISWPWFTLGNGFSYSTKLIQWYEITGVFGGSLWILLVNLLVFNLFTSSNEKNQLQSLKRKRLIYLSLLIFLPLTISLVRYYSYTEDPNPRKMVVVQPNIDPYMKFKDIPQIEQTKIQVSEAAKLTTAETDYVIAPETSISGQYWVSLFEQYSDIKMVRAFIENYPKLKYVVGVFCYERYTEPEDVTISARPLSNTGYFYDTHNSAIQLDSSDHIPIYHKSQLVTGVEKMPYKWLFKPLEGLTVKLGGIFRNHGIQEEREVFFSPNDSIGIAPVICYESIFGEFVTDYIKKGANYIFVITNDGWWKDTPGHRQHNALSSIRAIETRRSIARSANTGISCFINQRGDVLNKLTWWQRGAIENTLNANDKLTFYVKYGDYIGRGAFYIMLLALVFHYTLLLKTRIGKN